MPVAAIVYGTASGQLRRSVVADTEADARRGAASGIGESIIIIPADQVMANGVPDQETACALITAQTGKDAHPVRVGQLDKTGAPIGTLLADPLLDTLPNGQTIVPIVPKRYVTFNPPNTFPIDMATGKPSSLTPLPTNVVVGVVMADPRFDPVPVTAVQHATADVGWTRAAGVLTKPVAVVAAPSGPVA